MALAKAIVVAIGTSLATDAILHPDNHGEHTHGEIEPPISRWHTGPGEYVVTGSTSDAVVVSSTPYVFISKEPYIFMRHYYLKLQNRRKCRNMIKRLLTLKSQRFLPEYGGG